MNNIVNAITRDKKKIAIIGVTGLLVILLVIAFSGNGKQRVLGKSLVNFIEAESYHTHAKLDLDLPARVGQNAQQPLLNMTMEIEGDVLEGDDSQPVFTGTLRNEARGRGMVLFADGELTLLPDAAVFRLDNLPVLLNPKGNLTDKWTYVEVPTLKTNNVEQVTEVLKALIAKAEYVNKDEGLYHYQIALTGEDEDVLTDVFRQGNSGNRSLNIFARLLRAYEVGSLEVWVDPSGDKLMKIATAFVKPQEGGSFEEKATLTLDFSDYGKKVVVEEPPKELTVQPEVFGRMFGSGDIPGL